jgi:hypothetical protein
MIHKEYFMDKDRLLGPVLRQEAKKRRKQEKAAAKAAIRAAQAKELEEAEQAASKSRQDAFEDLGKRNTSVIERVRAFTEGGASWGDKPKSKFDDRVIRQGKVVVLAPAPRSKVTPDHVAVCLVGYAESRWYGSGDTFTTHRKWAYFSFAFVPRDELDKVVNRKGGYPLSAVRESGILARTESTYLDTQGLGAENSSSITQRGSALSKVSYATSRQKRVAYEAELSKYTAGVATAEHSLEWVLQAAADADLNPHLQDSAEAISLQ